MDQARSPRQTTSTLLPMATVVFAIGIFIADTITHLEIAVAVLYVAVVLMASGFGRRGGILLVAGGCVGLTLLSYFLSAHGPTSAAIVNTLISIVTIALTTFLVLQRHAAEVTL